MVPPPTPAPGLTAAGGHPPGGGSPHGGWLTQRVHPVGWLTRTRSHGSRSHDPGAGRLTAFHRHPPTRSRTPPGNPWPPPASRQGRVPATLTRTRCLTAGCSRGSRAGSHGTAGSPRGVPQLPGIRQKFGERGDRAGRDNIKDTLILECPLTKQHVSRITPTDEQPLPTVNNNSFRKLTTTLTISTSPQHDIQSISGIPFVQT